MGNWCFTVTGSSQLVVSLLLDLLNWWPHCCRIFSTGVSLLLDLLNWWSHCCWIFSTGGLTVAGSSQLVASLLLDLLNSWPHCCWIFSTGGLTVGLTVGGS